MPAGPPPSFKPGDNHWTDKPNTNIEFRYYGTQFDELVANGVDIHLERMDTGSWWMGIRTKDGREWSLNFGVERTKSADDDVWMRRHLYGWGFHEEDTWPPPPWRPNPTEFARTIRELRNQATRQLQKINHLPWWP